ncbi:FAD-binding protein [Rugosimonospora africana]|nr:FAD-binding protein [Rugosimonospora africana]
MDSVIVPADGVSEGHITNWAGNVTFTATRLHRPSSVDDLRRLVADAPRVRVLGTGHSFNRLADTDGVLVSVAGLPPSVEVDPAGRGVTVAAGVRLGDLATRLHAQGYALANLPSLPHISVAGAVATGTHGSGTRNRNLGAAVSAVRLVTADGDVRTVRRGEDETFDGTVVALGALGVVTGLTMDIVPTFDVRQYVYDDMPLDRLVERLDEVLSAGYSVSLFTDWAGERVNQVWVKHRVGDPGEPPAGPWLGGTPADGPRHPVPGMSAAYATAQQGRPGPWHERLPHFRLEFTPSSGEELQTEYFVARERAAAAIAAVNEIRERIAPVLQICELRTIAADELWLSPNYRRDSLALHFTWVPDIAAVTPVVAEIERRLDPFAPRPHWGKVFTMAPSTVRSRYERHADFVRLAHRYDPAGKFRNDFVDSYLAAG